MGDDYLDVILLILGFLAVLYAAYYTTRIYGSKFKQGGQGKYLKIIDRIIMTNDKWICLIQVGQQYFLVAISNQNMELLASIDQKDLVPINNEETVSFNNLIEKYINRNKQNKDDFGNHGETGYLTNILNGINRHKIAVKNMMMSMTTHDGEDEDD